VTAVNCRVWPFHATVAFLYGVADVVIRRLQSVLHAAARLITGIRRYEHITPTLRDTLYWLPISQRITFKMALMPFDCSRGRCPKYFGDVCTPVHTVAARSRLPLADHCDLIVPRAHSDTVHSVWLPQFPRVWTNKLEQTSTGSVKHREQFRRRLEGWLFECANGMKRVW